MSFPSTRSTLFSYEHGCIQRHGGPDTFRTMAKGFTVYTTYAADMAHVDGPAFYDVTVCNNVTSTAGKAEVNGKWPTEHTIRSRSSSRSPDFETPPTLTTPITQLR